MQALFEVGEQIAFVFQAGVEVRLGGVVALSEVRPIQVSKADRLRLVLVQNRVDLESGRTPEAFAAEIRADVARWGPIMHAAGIRGE